MVVNHNKKSSVSKQADNAREYEGVYKHMFKFLDVLWSVMPNYLGTVVATVLIFIGGSVMRGKLELIIWDIFLAGAFNKTASY